MVVHRNGRPFVLEASATVRMTPVARWVARGERGHVVVKRLANREAVLDEASWSRMLAIGRSLLGRPYDLRFEWSDVRMYCTELVHEIYARGAGVRIGALRPARSFDLSSPAVRRILTERFGADARFDPDAPMLSPASMFEDAQLVTVDGR